MRPWLRVPHDFYQDPRLWALPDDGARFAWLAVLGAAKVSATPGRFSGRSHFLASVPSMAGYNLDAYLATGLLRVAENGEVVVADWAGQNDPTAAERQARRRESLAYTPPVLVPEPEPEPPNEAADAYARVALLAEQLTGRPYVLGDPHTKMGERASDLLDRHGEAAVIATFHRVAKSVGGRPTIGQLVLGAGNALDPVPSIKAEPKEEPMPKRRCRDCKGSGMVPLDILPNGTWEPDRAGYPAGMKPCACGAGRTA